MHLEIGVTRLHAEASTNINNVGASWCINLSSALSLSRICSAVKAFATHRCLFNL
jgi:hypothetical protein